MIAIVTLTLALAAPGLGPPPGDAAVLARLEPLLGTIDRPTPTTAWRALPPEARALLEAIAADPDQLPSRRAAAVSGLTAIGGDGALHRRLAEDRSAPYLVRARALRGLGLLLPEAALAGPLPRLLREDPDRRIRAAAAETLAHGGTAEGCAAVRSQAAREAADARSRFGRALADCSRR